MCIYRNFIWCMWIALHLIDLNIGTFQEAYGVVFSCCHTLFLVPWLFLSHDTNLSCLFLHLAYHLFASSFCISILVQWNLGEYKMFFSYKSLQQIEPLKHCINKSTLRFMCFWISKPALSISASSSVDCAIGFLLLAAGLSGSYIYKNNISKIECIEISIYSLHDHL